MNMMKFLRLLFVCSFLSVLFCSCDSKTDSSCIIDLKDSFQWAMASAQSSIEEIPALKFEKFSTAGVRNISRIVGTEGQYIWLKADFAIPHELQNELLGFLISYLHFSEKAWLNGCFIGETGSFPPNEKSVMWGPHFYSLPSELLTLDGTNSLVMKVWCHGLSGISDYLVIGKYAQMKRTFENMNFRQSLIYTQFEGGIFCAAILFFVIYIWRRKEREYLSFSLLCFSSMLFVSPFFASGSLMYINDLLSHLWFMKLTMYEGFYLCVFFASTFIIEFMHQRESMSVRILRCALFLICTVLTMLAPDYNFLLKFRVILLLFGLTGLQLLISCVYVVKASFNKENIRRLLIIVFAGMPLLITMIVDAVVKEYFQNITMPYLTIFGWQGMIIAFLVVFSVKYNRAIVRNESLAVELRNEVQRQTEEISERRKELETEIARSKNDLDMAAIVQKKIFPYPPKSLRGWDIAVSYNPLDKVSGDLYDYYSTNENLDGFSLFDVSGHGIASGLVTMMAKNIIFQSFVRNNMKHETVSRMLYEINDAIIEAKGDVENYLTGIMFRFCPFDGNDECRIEMANAGHPNPILFNAKSCIAGEIESGDSSVHYGAIGLDFITVSFPQVSFTMAEDDILVFYTDGLSEGRNVEKEQFGSERIKKIVRNSYAKSAQSILEDLVDAYADFTEGAKRRDDITIVVLKRENSQNYIEELNSL